MHWGTWVLTEEDVLEPPKLLKQALSRNTLPEEGVFDVCDIGETRTFDSTQEVSNPFLGGDDTPQTQTADSPKSLG